MNHSREHMREQFDVDLMVEVLHLEDDQLLDKISEEMNNYT